MTTIFTTENAQQRYTLLSNDFIDHHMAGADGEYVKIYLLILRLQAGGQEVTADRIADVLELTRKDVLRAIAYWEKEGLLSTSDAARPLPDAADEPDPAQSPGEAASSGQAASYETPATDTPETQPVHTAILFRTVEEKKTLSPAELEQLKDNDLKLTIYMAETYLGRPFSSTELNSLCYISRQLHFSSELIEYLVEYCVGRGKRSMRYIEKVAVEWYQQGITTVAMAKEQTKAYSDNVHQVLRAFGIGNRNPGAAELSYIERWNTMGFDAGIITEACNRTLLATQQASFPYANKILEEWKKAGVRTAADIKRLDRRHQSEKKSAGAGQGTPRKQGNRFHNFDQRTYDYGKLESALLKKGRR